MSGEENLERLMNKLNITKIIHTENLSNEIAETIIGELYDSFPFKEHENGSNKYYEGFNKEYVLPHKINYKKDKDFRELKYQNTILSKIYKNTYAIDKGDGSSFYFVETLILPSLNLICIIGNKKHIKKPASLLKEKLNSNNVLFEEINFSHSFLMWVLWKLQLGQRISPEITIDFFDDLKVGLTNPNMVPTDNTPNSIKTMGDLNQLCNNAKNEFEDMMLAFNEFKTDYLLKLESSGD